MLSRVAPRAKGSSRRDVLLTHDRTAVAIALRSHGDARIAHRLIRSRHGEPVVRERQVRMELPAHVGRDHRQPSLAGLAEALHALPPPAHDLWPERLQHAALTPHAHAPVAVPHDGMRMNRKPVVLHVAPPPALSVRT